MDFILFSAITRQTGNALAAELGIRGAETPPKNAHIDTLIRWGSSAHPELEANVIINNWEAIALATSKFDALEVLALNNIPVPKQIRIDSLEEHTLQAVAATGLTTPVLARQDNHTRGRDIILCLQNKDLRRAIRWGRTHLTEYIPTKDEYRLHVFGNEIIKISRKALVDRDNYISYLRNDDNNHVYKTTKIKLTNTHKNTAIAAVAALGLDFGAVDMVISDNDEEKVLEVNTGPSLIESGVNIYSDKFRTIIEG